MLATVDTYSMLPHTRDKLHHCTGKPIIEELNCRYCTTVRTTQKYNVHAWKFADVLWHSHILKPKF